MLKTEVEFNEVDGPQLLGPCFYYQIVFATVNKELSCLACRILLVSNIVVAAVILAANTVGADSTTCMWHGPFSQPSAQHSL